MQLEKNRMTNTILSFWPLKLDGNFDKRESLVSETWVIKESWVSYAVLDLRVFFSFISFTCVAMSLVSLFS